MRRIDLFASASILLILLGGCVFSQSHRQPSVPPPPQTAVEPPAHAEPPAAPKAALRLMAVGDIMMHKSQIDSGFDAATGRYSYASFFKEIAPLLREADLVTGNLETVFAGCRTCYSGYPRFNAPERLAQDLNDAGFDVITTANNHALDCGEQGLVNTLAVLDRAGLLHTGTFQSADSRQQPLIVEKNGIRLLFLAYTYGTNGIEAPPGKDYLVNRIDLERIGADLAAAREHRVDLVVCALHFGQEYARQPDGQQKALVEKLHELGVDIVLGSHPHVVQPAVWDQKNNTYAIYSLGNFISSQRGEYRDFGVVVDLELEKSPPENRTSIRRVTYHPTYVDIRREKNRRHFEILRVEQVEENLDQERFSRLKDKIAGKNAELIRHLESAPAVHE